jgi:hypothetical protein
MRRASRRTTGRQTRRGRRRPEGPRAFVLVPADGFPAAPARPHPRRHRGPYRTSRYRIAAVLAARGSQSREHAGSDGAHGHESFPHAVSHPVGWCCFHSRMRRTSPVSPEHPYGTAPAATRDWQITLSLEAGGWHARRAGDQLPATLAVDLLGQLPVRPASRGRRPSPSVNLPPHCQLGNRMNHLRVDSDRPWVTGLEWPR